MLSDSVHLPNSPTEILKKKKIYKSEFYISDSVTKKKKLLIFYQIFFIDTEWIFSYILTPEISCFILKWTKVGWITLVSMVSQRHKKKQKKTTDTRNLCLNITGVYFPSKLGYSS